MAAARHALGDRDDLVRVCAIELVVALNDTGSTRTVAQQLGADDELLVAYAAWGVGRLGDRRSIPRLRQLLEDRSDVVRCGAAEALYRLTRERAHLARVRAILRSSDPQARAFAANSLVGMATTRNIRQSLRLLREAEARETFPAIRMALRSNARLLDDPSIS